MSVTAGQLWWERLHTWIRLNWVVLRGLGAGLALLALLRLLPFQAYWEWVFEGSRLYLFWPLVVVLTALAFVESGSRFHRATGAAVYLPGAAIGGALVLLAAAVVLILEWGVDWSLMWAHLAWLLLLGAMVLTMAGVMRHAELWRLLLNPQVVRQVQMQLRSGTLQARTRARLERRRRTGRPEWGSPHCLRIVEHHYLSRRRELWGSGQALCRARALPAFFQAGDTLVGYLSLDFAALEAETLRRRRAAILWELITTGLYCLQHTRYEAVVPATLEDIRRWRRQLEQDLGEDQPEVHHFLAWVFDFAERNLSLTPDPPSAKDIRHAVSEVTARWEQLPRDSAAEGDMPPGRFRRLCSRTWLALSHGLPGQVYLDVWLAWGREEGEDFLWHPPKDRSLITLLGLRRLQDLYAAWHPQIQEPWHRGVEGRKVYLAHLLEELQNSPEPLPEVEAESRAISSWPYREVWETPAVRWFTGFLAAAAGALLFMVLVSTLPCHPLNVWRWNTIDHLSDRRAFHDYTKSGLRAMAVSPRWLALASDRSGLILINKDSRVPRTGLTPGAARDVALAPGEDTFLVLQGNQGLTLARPIRFLANRFTLEPWLPAPPQPFWKTPKDHGAVEVVNSALTEDGWLVAVRGLGVARYPLSRTPEGDQVRGATWETGTFSPIPLEAARFTQHGFWVTLAGGGIRYGDARTLKEDAARKTQTPPLVSFDADYQGTWAAAVDGPHGLWLFSAGAPGWQGPFFQKDPNPVHLKQASEVTVAHLAEPTAWLGTPYGLFAYDTEQRRLHCVLPRVPINQRNFLPFPAVAAQTPVRAALVGTRQGLFWVSGPHPEAGNKFQTAKLSEQQIDSLSASGDFRLVLFTGRAKDAPPGSPLGAFALPEPGPKSRVLPLTPEKGWKNRASPPQVVGLARRKDTLLFATREGAFSYHPDKREYRDYSKGLIPLPADSKGSPRSATLSRFTRLEVGKNGLLAVADGHPWLLPEGKTEWQGLEPAMSSRPQALLDLDGTIWGLEPGKRLLRYSYPTPEAPQEFLIGQAPSLKGKLPGQTARGDMVVQSDGPWRLVMVPQDRLITYDSARGAIAEAGLPVPALRTVQIRLAGSRVVFLQEDGSVIDGQERLGGQGLPFPPTRLTALAPETEGASLLAAGPDGQVRRYRFEQAAWSPVGPRLLPAAAPGDEIAFLQRTPHTLMAQLQSGRCFFLKDSHWREFPRAQGAAADRAGRHLFVRTSGEVQKLKLPEDKKPVEVVTLPKISFSRVAGMGDFLRRSVLAWECGPSRVAFLTQEGRLGIYERQTDNFTELPIMAIGGPPRMAVGGSSLLLADKQRLRLLDKDGQLREIATLPAGADRLSLQVDREHLRAAFVTQERVAIRRWSRKADGVSAAVEYKLKPSSPPPDFHPAFVVLARAQGDDLLLVNEFGACTGFNLHTRQWRVLRPVRQGELLLGWRKVEGRVELLLAASGKELLVTLAADSGSWRRSFEIDPVVLTLEERRTFLPPPEGLLVDTKTLRIHRQGGYTTYHIQTPQGWRPLAATPGGFALDAAKPLATALSPQGRLWVLREGWLVNYEPAGLHDFTLIPTPRFYPVPPEAAGLETLPTGHLCLWEKSGRRLYFKETPEGDLEKAPEPSPVQTASLDFAGQRLQFSWRPHQTIEVKWENPALKVWGEDGQLAVHCLRGLVLTEEEELLVSTEAGLLVRDARTYTLKKIFPELPPALAWIAEGPRRILFRTSTGRFYLWEGGAPKPLPGGAAAAESHLTVGPWRWQWLPWDTGQGGIRVVHRDDGRPRQVREIHPQDWRFRDDLVTWIHREAKGQGLWLETEDGWYPYQAGKGRLTPAAGSAGPPPEPLAPETVRLSTPALTVTYERGVIRFVPKDGDARELFLQGRFFFDYHTDFCAHQGRLYCLVPGRGVVPRNPARPGEVLGFWPLPPLGDTPLSLRADARGPYLEAAGAGAGRWRLEFEGDRGLWRPETIPEEKTVATTWPVTWRRAPSPEPHYVPFPLTAAGPAQALENWWSHDRFAWDLATQAAALDRHTAVLVNPLGVLIQPLPDSPSPGRQFLLLQGVRYCETVRQGQQDHLVLVGTSQGQYALARESQGNFSLRPDQTPRRRSRLELGYLGQGQDRHIGLTQKWVELPPGGTEPAGGLLESRLEHVPTANLLHEGRFVFDQADGACPWPGGAAAGRFSRWLLYHRTSGTSTILSTNDLEPGAAGRGRLLLRDYLPAPCPIQALRPGPEGQVWVLSHPQPEPPRLLSLQVGAGGPALREANLAAAREAFRVGDQVRVDATRCRWERQPRYLWDTRPPLTVTPAGYPLFTREAEGLALSFDYMTALALDRRTRRLAVGTKGGVFLFPYHDRGEHLRRSSTSPRLLPLEVGGSRGDMVLQVERLRFDESGRLWVRFGPGGIMARQASHSWSLTRETWPSHSAHRGGLRLSAEPRGLRLNRQIFTRSFEPWLLGVRPLPPPLELHLEADLDTAWLANPNEGVFKVLPRRLDR